MLSTSSVSRATLTFFRVGTSSVATTTHSSVSSRAVRICSSNAGAVSTTTKSKPSLSVRRIARHQHRRHPLADVGVQGGGQHHQRLLVAGQERLQRGQVEQVLGADGLLDRVRREQLQGDGDVAEGEVEVDQADLAGAALGEGEREVDRHRGLADAPLRREDGDDLAEMAGPGRAAQGLGELVGLADGGLEGGGVAELDDVTRAGLHRPGEERGVEGRRRPAPRSPWAG